MAMQVSDSQQSKTVKSKGVSKGGGRSRKAQTMMKEQENLPTLGSVSIDGLNDRGVKVEPGGMKVETDQMDDRKLDQSGGGTRPQSYNGHTDAVHAGDIKPKLEEIASGSTQGQDSGFASLSSSGGPGRDSTPTGLQRLPSGFVGPTGSGGGMPTGFVGPNNGGVPMGLGMPAGSRIHGGQMQGGHLQVAAGGHFMQHQSQIFVFSTQLANQAADAVQCGQYKNIVDFHIDQPGTMQYLQKFAGSGFPMPPGFDVMSSRGQPKDGPPMGEQTSALANVAQWVQQQNANLQHDRSFSPSNPAFTIDPDMGKPIGRYGRTVQHWAGPPDNMGPAYQQMCGGPGGQPPEFMHELQMAQADLLHNKVPNENLTPEQLQRRDKQLAHLRKIKQMLFPEQQQPVQGGCGDGGMMGMMQHTPDGDGMMLMSPEMWNNGGPPQMGMHPGMMRGGPPPMMMDSPPSPNGPMMTGMNYPPGPMGGGQYGGMMPGAGLPPNWDSMTSAQREWFKLQQEYYMDKCRKQQQMGPGRGGYFNPMQQRTYPGGPMSPISPSFAGPMPSPHCAPNQMPGDQAFMFSKSAEFGGGPMNFPGGPDGGFDRMSDGMFGFNDGPMHQRMHSMNPDPYLGNPNDFGPMGVPPGMGMPPGNKLPPPGYGVHKRKRSVNTATNDDEMEMFKRLLPAPSPQQFSYVNPLEGQELTITKQLNLAYQDQQQQAGGQSVSSPPSYHQQQHHLQTIPKTTSRPTANRKKKKVPTATLR